MKIKIQKNSLRTKRKMKLWTTQKGGDEKEEDTVKCAPQLISTHSQSSLWINFEKTDQMVQ